MSWDPLQELMSANKLTLRDEFAIGALAVVGPRYARELIEPSPETIANEAYAIADAMLQRRKVNK